MGQYWKLFNVDKRQYGQGVDGKFPEFFPDEHDWLVKLLARPDFPEAALPLYYSTTPVTNKAELGSFSDFPPEVMALLYEHIPSVDDVTCLAVTHRAFMPEGFRRTVELRRAEFAHWGSWTGDRIITAGDYLDDLPEGMLTPAEKKKTSNGSKFYDFASKYYKLNPPLDRHPQLTRMDWLLADMAEDDLGNAMHRVSRRTGDYHRVRLFFETTAPRYAPDATWALCNVTLKKYVRAIELARMKIGGEYVQQNRKIEGPLLKGRLGLGHLAIVMTAESSEMPDGTYGGWAGNRLMISTVEGLPEGWKDASAEVVEVMRECVLSNDDILEDEDDDY